MAPQPPSIRTVTKAAKARVGYPRPPSERPLRALVPLTMTKVSSDPISFTAAASGPPAEGAPPHL